MSRSQPAPQQSEHRNPSTPLPSAGHQARADQLKTQLSNQFYDIETVQWLAEAGSTNDIARSFEGKGNTLIISDLQLSGRGQAGRVWQSPSGNLYLSLLAGLHHAVSGRLALEVALALANIPILTGIHDIQIKWPNDLYYQQAKGQQCKWGGILIEPLHQNQVVIGVGINLVPMQDQVRDQQVTDLSSILGKQIDRYELAYQVTQALFHACEHFDHGSLQLSTRFAAFDALLEQQVVVSQTGQPDIQGEAFGIQADGALIVSDADKQHVIYSGHVRPLDLTAI